MKRFPYSFPRRTALLALGMAFAVMSAGCFSLRREAPRPGRTTLGSQLIVLPARTISNYLIVESTWDRHGPYHFLIDTGASVTLISPELAERYQDKSAFPPNTPRVQVKSATDSTVMLTATVLKRVQLGEARFQNVPALIYDCAELSAHLGLKIDGILGFPLFRETLLTLDYPQGRVILMPRDGNTVIPGTPIPFNNPNKTPLISVKLGSQSFITLIDSGSDAPLNLNPVGLRLNYAVEPRAGRSVGTLSGDHEQRIGRLNQTLVLGDYALERPVVDLTDQLSSIGGEILKNFTLTFDQERNRVFFFRSDRAPITFPAHRNSGLSFSKTPAYWRVTTVIPDSPASRDGVQPGDLVVRINGEPVYQWSYQRYEQLVETATEIKFTFLNGSHENDRTLSVFDLVP